MSLVELGAIGELVGGLAVLGTLIYLALQVRQTNVAVSSSANHAVYGLSAELGLRIAENELFVDVMLLAAENPDEMSPRDLVRFGLLNRSVFRVVEFTYLQHRSGALPEELFDGVTSNVRDLMRSKATRDWWFQDRHVFGEGFQNWLDGITADESGANGSSWDARIREASSGGQSAT